MTVGGLHIIEDLVCQPDHHARRGNTRSAARLQTSFDNRQVSHPEPLIPVEFDALAPHVSGAFAVRTHCRKPRRDTPAAIQKR